MKRTFARMSTASRHFRDLLVRGDLDTLATFQTEAAHIDLEAIAQLASRAQERGRTPKQTLEVERQEARRSIEAVEAVVSAGFREDLSVRELVVAIGRLTELKQARAQLSACVASLRALGVGEELLSQHAVLEATYAAADQAHGAGLPLAAVAALSAPERRAYFVQSLGALSDGDTERRRGLRELGLDASLRRVTGESVSLGIQLLDQALKARELLRAQLQLLRELQRLDAMFCAPIAQLYRRGVIPADALEPAIEYALYGALIQLASEKMPILRQGSGHERDAIRAQYRSLDRDLLALNAKAIAAKLHRVPVPSGVASGRKAEWTELALVRHEMSKRMRHISVRQLIQRAGGAIRALKPCVMMSPLSAAQFLPRMREQFDLVVIDEASQMRPEDAIGAITRGKRVVVVGDPKQLPPTAFFRSLQSASEEQTEDSEEDEAIEAESILDLGYASFGEARDLRWHYRSRHPSLIAFSNRHFYDDRLKVFPTAHANEGELGVQLVQVQGEYASSMNEIEADRIADAVLNHVRQAPNRSLGVVAMNIKQRDLILDKLNDKKDELFQRFEDAGANGQPFFVKSLENVQGDERDVIFVSMTYGPDPKSKRVLQRFGPINGAYGARRLNVLFTRARERLVVFSSLRPDHVLAEEGASPGLKALKAYLVYAERGELGELTRNGGETESPFEDSVREVLHSAGYETEAQVGVQGFFIDLGVKRSGQPGYVCGVECDGATYHSHRSARDRDRLRQDVLEAQGWRIVRVWSTDWFRNPIAARERLLEMVRGCSE